MSKPHALLRAGFPFIKTLGMRRVTNHPTDVAITSDDTVFVLNRAGAHLTKLPFVDKGDDWGQFLPTIGKHGSGDGEFEWPVAIIMDKSEETIFISDESLHRITLLDRDGVFVGKWGKYGCEDGEFNRPSGIARDSEGNVYVVDTLNQRVQKLTRDGKFLLKWGSFGQGQGEFNMPWGVAVDEEGDVYIGDWRNDRIQKFNGEGKFLFSIGRPGNANGEFNRPAGVEVDSDGDIYVADSGNDRVQVFDPAGRYLSSFLGDATLSNMARSYLMTNAQSLRLREMSDLEPQKFLRSPRSVRVDQKGRMFIPDNRSFRVQVYQKEAIPLTAEQIAAVPRSPTLFVN